MAPAKRPAPAAGAPRAAEGSLPPAARVLRAALLGLLALRVLLMFTPGRPLWGFDLGRDLAPATFWLPLALTLLAFVPRVGLGLARLVPADARAGAPLAVALSLALALLLWMHPDRALYNGDTSLRHGAFAATAQLGPMAEQALRGDLVLHHDLPRWFAAHTPWNTEVANRLLGVLLAFVTGLAAWRLAVDAGATGPWWLAVMAVALATGALALDNGYGKATVELAALTTLIAVGVTRAARDGGGALVVGLAVAAALLLHRSALALLPAWLACTWLAFASGRARAWTTWVGVAAPPLALAVVGPDLVRIIGSFDVSHHLHGGAAPAVRSALTPARLADSFNALGILLPLAPAVPFLLAAEPRPGRREFIAWGALVLPLLALLLLVHPQHGMPRDWDVFACAGAALAAFAAWRAARLYSRVPAAAALALPLAAVALVPALQWAVLQADPARTWTRAESVLLGPPARDPTERAYGFATIGMLCLGRGQAETARRMFQRSAEAAPNPSTFVRWGMAETMLGHPADAMAHYTHATGLDTNLVLGWRGVAAAASALGDRARMEQAARQLQRLEPDGQSVRDVRAWLQANPARR